MARHNQVLMYGQVMEGMKVLYNSTDENNKDREIVRIICPISTMRGIREFGAVDKRIRLDYPIILTQNKKMIELMKTWETGDIVLISGTLATNNTKILVRCPNCGHTEQIDYMVSFINPIYAKTEAKKLDLNSGNMELRKNAEISNRITIIGKCCMDPITHPTPKGQIITNYQLDVARKYRIKEDDESNKHDFPFVKSYGAIATNDAKYIKKDAMVFVDGAIQTREYTRKYECPECGFESQYITSATEIIPYATEYLMNCKTPEEVAEEEAHQIEMEGAAARAAAGLGELNEQPNEY